MKIIQSSTLTPEVIARLGQTEKDWIYNGLDCCLTYEIDDALDEFMDEIDLNTYNMSLALQAPILEMNMRGILIDLESRDKAIASLTKDAEKIDRQFDYLCESIFGRKVNAGSWQQTNKLMYEWLSLPEQKKRNSKGEWTPTTDREALEKLASLYFTAKPFVNHILASRDLWKQISTLSTPLLNGRFYTSLSIAGTKTGRLASALSDFAVGSNLQNIDRRIRTMFTADPGMKFCNIDLEQADARNVGAQTWNLFPELGDSKRFLDFAESGDLHTAVCALCWRELPWTDDPKENRAIADQPAYREKSYRDMAKILGHGTNFNGQAPQMAKHTKVAQGFISDFQARYFGAFPEVKQRIEYIGNELVDKGYLVTLFGRRRYFLKRRGDNKTLNEGCAFDPQSMTADEINNALIRIYTVVKKRYPMVELLIQVHDSLLLQYPEELEDEIIPWIREAMRVVIRLRKNREFFVPSEAQVGWNWGYRVDWSKKDFEKGDCSKEQIGTCKDNPNGMIKYKGHDSRKRV